MKTITPEIIRSLFPVRAAQSNKGSFGRVLVIAGSRMMTGAGVLCAKSVLKSGAGLVVLALPKTCQPFAASQLPEMLTLPLAETVDGIISQEAISVLTRFILAYKIDLIVVGPGLGNASFVPAFLKVCNLPVIIDADALNQIAVQEALSQLFPRKRPSVCTPHPGEMSRLIGQEISLEKDVRREQVAQLSAITGSVCLLKGKGTLISCGKEIFENTTGGPALAKAGTGDILSGMIAGLWAQLGKTCGFTNQTAFDAAVCGVYLHGLCGDLAANELTDTCVLAGDLLDYLPAAIKQTLKVY